MLVVIEKDIVQKIHRISGKLRVMSIHLRIGCFFLCLIVDRAHGGNNSKTLAFRCNSSQKWKVLKLQGKEIEDACMKSDYYPRYPPKDKVNTQVLMLVDDIKVVNVDELSKTMTIDLKADSIWEDDRIIVNYNENKTYIDLEPLTKESMSELWTPYDYAPVMIQNMKKLRYIFDPITMHLGLSRSDFLMQWYGIDNIYPTNISLTWLSIAWRLTVSCPLDFSKFPFDKHTCPLRITFDNMNIIWQRLNDSTFMKNAAQQHSDGFSIKAILVPPKIIKDPFIENYYVTTLGFDIAITRLTSKYIFQYYIPCCAIVTTASFSFIIPFSAIPGRVALLVTQFLTLTNIFINLMVSIRKFYHIELI